jgi:hypothetical protein
VYVRLWTEDPSPKSKGDQGYWLDIQVFFKENILDFDIADADDALKKEYYGVPWSSDYRKNIKIIVKSQDWSTSENQHIQQIVISVVYRVQEGQQRAKSMDWMDSCNLPNLVKDYYRLGLFGMLGSGMIPRIILQ